MCALFFFALPILFGTQEVTSANADLQQSWIVNPHQLVNRIKPELVNQCCPIRTVISEV